MTNDALQIKVRQRLNKLASNDFDNIECWQIVEAFNKAQGQWTRRNLHGTNIYREGDEQSTIRKDDFQVLLTEKPLALNKRKDHYISEPLPSEYFRWKRVSIKASNDCCDERKNFAVYLAEEGNATTLLRDAMKQPNFEWGETFATLVGGKVKIYTADEFIIDEARLIYYREPRKIQIENCKDPYDGSISTVNVECEFKDDVTEILIDESIRILSGDTEAFNQFQRSSQEVEGNN